MKLASDAREISDLGKLPEMPVVSVCMLAYAHELYLPQAVRSILAQQCDFPIELVIGEDCSPDKTRELAFDLQRRHPDSIRVIASEKNVGMMANLRRTMAACRGRYVAFCEGDDYWSDPLKLQRQVDLLSRHSNIVLAAHPVQEMDAANGTLRATLRPTLSSRMVSMHELLLGDGGLLPSPSITYRRELLDRLPGWYYESPVGDFPLVLLAGMHGDVAVQNQCMAVYRRNVPGSWSQGLGLGFERRWADCLSMEATLARFDADTGGKYSIEIRQLLSKHYSDALLLDDGEKIRKLQAFGEVSARLIPLDRLFCRIALITPWKLTGLKTNTRKARSLFRILRGEMTMPRI